MFSRPRCERIPATLLDINLTDGESPMPDEGRRWRLGFWSLIVTQFQGAFNDNGLKFFVFFSCWSEPNSGTERFLGIHRRKSFCSSLLTFFNDRRLSCRPLQQTHCNHWNEVFEIAAMLFAFTRFACSLERWHLRLIFLASTQAAFFGPSKYGLLPSCCQKNCFPGATA